MSTWRRTLLFSGLIAAGLMFGHAAWVAIGVAHTDRDMALHLALFDPEAATEVDGTSDRYVSRVTSQASSLWSIASKLSSSRAWASGLLLVQLVTATLITFTIWGITHWIVRRIACRVPAGPHTSALVHMDNRLAPGWREVAISPLFAFLAATGLLLPVQIRDCGSRPIKLERPGCSNLWAVVDYRREQ